jgi:hypothetical protein
MGMIIALGGLLPKLSPAYGSRFKNNHRQEGANIKMKAYSQLAQVREITDESNLMRMSLSPLAHFHMSHLMSLSGVKRT